MNLAKIMVWKITGNIIFHSNYATGPVLERAYNKGGLETCMCLKVTMTYMKTKSRFFLTFCHPKNNYLCLLQNRVYHTFNCVLFLT